jgi:ketosteroid isomerase-like protein
MPIGQIAPSDDTSRDARRVALAEIAGDELVTAMISGDAMLTSEFHGVDGFFAAWDDWLAPFSTYVIEFEDAEVAPQDRLVVRTRQKVTPRGTDIAIDSEAAAVLEFRDERLVRIEFHLDPDLARRAAGLT